MRRKAHALLILLSLSLTVFTSCEKEDSPVILPPKGNSIPATVTMGETYDNEIYFDFETGLVKTSPVAAWDISFESSKDGYHVFVNGGMDIYVYNTQLTDAYTVNTSATNGLINTDFLPDFPNGSPDSTAIGEWKDASGASKNLVYILKYPDKVYKKIMIESVDATGYKIAYGGVDDATMQTITIPKEDQYNRVYFTFANGGSVVHPEPPKNTWDIVFTRYHHVYPYLNNTPYLVSGVLLNPNNTVCFDTTTNNYEGIDFSPAIASLPYTNARDVIGFDWKVYNFTESKYSVDPTRCYIIKNRNAAYYKLHFLDFYDMQGLKGTPSFEYMRIQ